MMMRRRDAMRDRCLVLGEERSRLWHSSFWRRVEVVVAMDSIMDPDRKGMGRGLLEGGVDDAILVVLAARCGAAVACRRVVNASICVLSIEVCIGRKDPLSIEVRVDRKDPW